jgi:hypothetical protein
MEKETKEVKKEVKIINKYGGNAGAGAVYGLGLIGALVYFLQNASGGNEILMGIFKAIAWPAFLIYRVLEILKI